MALEKDDEGRPRSHLEALAELRDYKRRRQTYRAKNQNSNRRSATDVRNIKSHKFLMPLPPDCSIRLIDIYAKWYFSRGQISPDVLQANCSCILNAPSPFVIV